MGQTQGPPGAAPCGGQLRVGASGLTAEQSKSTERYAQSHLHAWRKRVGRAKPLKPAGPSVRFADWGCLQEAFGQEWGEAICRHRCAPSYPARAAAKAWGSRAQSCEQSPPRSALMGKQRLWCGNPKVSTIHRPLSHWAERSPLSRCSLLQEALGAESGTEGGPAGSGAH